MNVDFFDSHNASLSESDLNVIRGSIENPQLYFVAFFLIWQDIFPDGKFITQ